MPHRPATSVVLTIVLSVTMATSCLMAALPTAEIASIVELFEDDAPLASMVADFLAVHGFDVSIDLRISRLRKKLGDDPAHPRRIKSVRGVGYMLSLEL